LDRRRFIQLVGAGAATALAAQVFPFGLYEGLPKVHASVVPFEKVIYSDVFNQKGDWDFLQEPEYVVPRIIESGARYVKAGAGSEPTSAKAVKAAKQLLNAGLILGVKHNPFYGSSKSPPKSLSRIRKETRALFNAKISGQRVYGFIFIDHALHRDDIQQIVDIVKDVGWTLISTNETGGEATPPTGIWSHRKALNLLNGSYEAKIQDFLNNYPNSTGITHVDIKWINNTLANDPGSVPVLKLEVESEVIRFAALPTDTQIKLLTAWAKNQSTYNYRTIYPIFVSIYDSVAAGTYDTQRTLISTYG